MCSAQHTLRKVLASPRGPTGTAAVKTQDRSTGPQIPMRVFVVSSSQGTPAQLSVPILVPFLECPINGIMQLRGDSAPESPSCEHVCQRWYFQC